MRLKSSSGESVTIVLGCLAVDLLQELQPLGVGVPLLALADDLPIEHAARGCGTPSLRRSSPASRLSRCSAVNSEAIAAIEYLPKKLINGNARLRSPA